MAALPAKPNTTIRTLTLADYKPAALTLAQAFWHDAVGRYPLDTPDRAHWTSEQKWTLHLSILEYITYAHILKGKVTAVGSDDGFGCVALWMPPGKHMDDYLTILRSGLWRLYFALSSQGRARLFTEFFPLLHDTKLDILGARDVESWYLVYLGTRDSCRGKRYAGCLVRDVLGVADREGRVCYLESSNVGNVGWYQRLGFVVKRRIVLEEGSVGLDVMVREAGGAVEDRVGGGQEVVGQGEVKTAGMNRHDSGVDMEEEEGGSTLQVGTPKLKVAVKAPLLKTEAGEKRLEATVVIASARVDSGLA